MKRVRASMVAALALCFFTFSAAAVINKDIFERLPHLEDEFAYLYQAKIFAGGHFWVPRDDAVRVFWQPFVIQPETSPDGVMKRFGKYTPGWPLLLAIGVLLAQPWFINATLAMLSVALVYRLGREIFDETVGVVSALLLAISPMALLLNATLMSHVPAMFMGVLFVYGYWRVIQQGKRRYQWAILGGLALGWMVLIRPFSALAVAAPVILHAVARLWDTLFDPKHPYKFLPKAQEFATLGAAFVALFLLSSILSSVTAAFSLALVMVACAVLVIAYWLMTRHDSRRYLWAVLSGAALVIPTTIAIDPVGHFLSVLLGALPGFAFAPPNAIRVFDAVVSALLILAVVQVISFVADTVADLFYRQKQPGLFLPRMRTMLVLTIFVMVAAVLWPLCNQIWTGDWRTNTYTLLWSYDTPGFGADHGLMPGGHTLEYGLRNARADMEWYLRDLFGVTMSPQINKYLTDNLGWGAGVGLSWIPVLLGLIYGYKHEWIWLFFEIVVAVIVAQLFYWIGSVVYGTAAYSLRYWYEATFAICLVAGYGSVAWARSLNKPQVVARTKKTGRYVVAYLNGLAPHVEMRLPIYARTVGQWINGLWDQLWPGYIILLVVCGFSLIGYTPARFHESLADWPNGLFRYNKVGQNQLDAIQAARDKYGKPGQHVLILVLRDPNPAVEDNWRDYGAAMAMTSPYLDSDIIVGRVFETTDAPPYVQRFSGRLVLYQIGENLYPTVEAALAGAQSTP